MASCGTLTVVEESSTDPSDGGGTNGGDNGGTDGSGGDGGSDGGGTNDGGNGGTSDVSQLNLQSVSRSSEVPNEITVNYTVQNQITSGDGESLTATVDIELDGKKVDEDYLGQIAPGQTPSGTIVLDGVDAGDHEVCVSVR